MFGFGLADVVVITAYLVGVTVLGVWVMRRVKDMGDFIMPRRFGKWMMTMHSFGTATHSDQAVSVASKSFTNGLSGIWYQWLYLFATPFYWLIAPMMRRFRALTVADIFELRYNPGVAGLYAVVSMIMMVSTIGLMLKGSGAVIDGASSGAVSADVAIIFMTILFVIYGTAGGLGAAIITDFIQGLLTIAFSFILLPFVLEAVGGIDGMRATINDPQMFSLVAPGDIGVFYITIITINALIGVVTQPHNLAPCAAGKTEVEGQVGFMVGSFTKRICTVAWSLTGLAGVAFFAGRDGVNPDHLYGMLASEFFPQLLPGLLGLFIATLLASVMSSCDSFMIAASALFTENIYKKVWPGRSGGHYLTVARIVSVGVVILGVLYAYWLEGVIQGLEIFWKVASMMGIAFWLGLFWRRTTPAAAWASTIGAFFAWWLTTQGFFIYWLESVSALQSWGLVVLDEGGAATMSLPWQMVFYLVTGLILGIVVSLMSRPTDPEKLERYYALLRTPVLTEEGNLPEPCTIPEGAVTNPPHSFFPNSSIEIGIPSRRLVVGFLSGWAVVVAIIAFVYFIAAV